jgi:ChrR Cupin-like domain
MKETKNRTPMPWKQSKSAHRTAGTPGLDQDVLDAFLVATAPGELTPARAAVVKTRVMERVRATTRLLENTRTVYCNVGKWTLVAPGVSMKILHVDDRGQSFLLRLDPGATLPAHPHDSDEECIVVEGELQLGDFNMRAGDYHLARLGSRHEDIFSPTGALVFIHREGRAPEGTQR